MLASLVFSAAAIAAAGDPDPTFSGDGKQRTDFGAGFSGAGAAARQADGKIVAVGRADDNFLVARYNPNGSLDPTFSGDGRVQTDFTGSDGAADVALQGNKIVVVGSSRDDDGFSYFALARYNPNGSLDPTFSGDGKQTADFGSDSESAAGVALQDDGKIVAVGHANGSTCCTSSFALARYNPNGSLDTTFSGDGKQTTDFGRSYDDFANGVAVQANGKIVAVGHGDDGTAASGFALARYSANGSLDTTFSGDGKQTTIFGCCGGSAADVAIQSNGKLVVAGETGIGADLGDFALARFTANGSLDTTFSGDGKQTTDLLFEDEDWANDVAIQASGRIVAVGRAGGSIAPGGHDFGLARYNPNGSLDTSFSGDGRKRTDFGGNDSALGVALQGDGRIVAVGNGNDEFALARYLGG